MQVKGEDLHACARLAPGMYVRAQVVEQFWRCGNCEKIFWMGPKSEAAIELVSGMLARARGPSEAAGVSFFNDGYLPAAAEDADVAEAL